MQLSGKKVILRRYRKYDETYSRWYVDYENR